MKLLFFVILLLTSKLFAIEEDFLSSAFPVQNKKIKSDTYQNFYDLQVQADFYNLGNDLYEGSLSFHSPVGVLPKKTKAMTLYLYSQLYSIVKFAKENSLDSFSKEEQGWLEGLLKILVNYTPGTGNFTDLDSIWFSVTKKLQFIEPSDSFFNVSSGTHRLVVTGSTADSIIYFNNKFFDNESLIPNKIEDEFVLQMISLLVHELTHHLGVKDSEEVKLDQFGNKVANVFKENVQFINSSILSLGIFNFGKGQVQDCRKQLSKFFILQNNGNMHDLSLNIFQFVESQLEHNEMEICDLTFFNPRKVSLKNYEALSFVGKNIYTTNKNQIDVKVYYRHKNGNTLLRKRLTVDIEILESSYGYIETFWEWPLINLKIVDADNLAPQKVMSISSQTDKLSAASDVVKINIPSTDISKIDQASLKVVFQKGSKELVKYIKNYEGIKVQNSWSLDFKVPVFEHSYFDKVNIVALYIKSDKIDLIFAPQFSKSFALANENKKESHVKVKRISFKKCVEPYYCEMYLSKDDTVNKRFIGIASKFDGDDFPVLQFTIESKNEVRRLVLKGFLESFAKGESNKSGIHNLGLSIDSSSLNHPYIQKIVKTKIGVEEYLFEIHFTKSVNLNDFAMRESFFYEVMVEDETGFYETEFFKAILF
jgi:hypothetical protein